MEAREDPTGEEKGENILGSAFAQKFDVHWRDIRATDIHERGLEAIPPLDDIGRIINSLVIDHPEKVNVLVRGVVIG